MMLNLEERVLHTMFSAKRFALLAVTRASVLASFGVLAGLPFLATAQGTYTLPPDRATTWKPGVTYNGGIPTRTQCGPTLTPSGGNDLTQIQNAINACPANQFVLLGPGTFTISGMSQSISIRKSNVTLRGSGPGITTVTRSDGTVDGSGSPRAQAPIIWVGPNRYPQKPTIDGGAAYNFASDGADGAFSVVLASAPSGGFTAGQIVLISELSGATYQPDPAGRGSVLMETGGKIIYQCHSPKLGGDDCDNNVNSLPDRLTQEVKEVASWNGGTMTLTFTTPFHTVYRTARTAQVATFAPQHYPITGVGVEEMTLSRGDAHCLLFLHTTYSWARRVEVTKWLGRGIAFQTAFRSELRDSYVHTPVWFEPGGASYNIALWDGSSEILIENNISRDANKVLVAETAGAGSVVAYNYLDDGRIGSNPGWQETGLGASHQIGSHHVLFEGNWAFNADNDNTHGNANTHTYFRNQLRGVRSSYANQDTDGVTRAAGAMSTSRYMSFVGNVLGASGQMGGWRYEAPDINGAAGIWMLGWDGVAPYPNDPLVMQTTIRDGNFDYLTNQVHWHGLGGSGASNGLVAPANSQLPNSMYLTSKPPFFGSMVWPWVEPTGSTKLYSLPAKARYDAGTPFAPPPGAPAPNAPTALSVLP